MRSNGPETATRAFRELQRAMTTASVLALPDFTRPFDSETDASCYGLGAVLMQDGRPIAFFSQVLGTRAQLKSVYERKLMAIVLAIQKWRPYLLGRPFRVVTDQKSLRYLLEQLSVPGDHQKWLAKLSGYEFEIVYRPGKENSSADALSRRVEPTSLCQMSGQVVTEHSELLQELRSDPEITHLRDQVRAAYANWGGYTIIDGIVRYEGRLVLPRTSPWIPKLFRELHAGATGGHEGVQKTYQRMAKELYWVGMRWDVAKMVAECDVCQRHKHSNLSPAGLLQPLQLPERIWEDVTIDFIEGLPKSDGYNVIMVVVDRLSKSAHFVSLKHRSRPPP